MLELTGPCRHMRHTWYVEQGIRGMTDRVMRVERVYDMLSVETCWEQKRSVAPEGNKPERRG